MTIQSTLRVGLCALVIGLPMLAFAGPAVDGDGDGIPDVIDNCSTVANAGAAGCDDDKDGYGNACAGDFNNELTSHQLRRQPAGNRHELRHRDRRCRLHGPLLPHPVCGRRSWPLGTRLCGHGRALPLTVTLPGSSGWRVGEAKLAQSR